MQSKFKSFIKKNLLFKISKPILSKIKNLKNKHQSESCYLIGDGISLKYFDLKSFSNKVSFSLSTLPFHKDFKFLNCKYAICGNPYLLYPRFFNQYWTSGKRKKFRSFINTYKEKIFFMNILNYPLIRNSNIMYFSNTIPDNHSFIEECNLKNQNIFSGTIRSSIALAIYMGFEKIFLVGCDYTHENSYSRHWYEIGKGIPNPQINYQKEFFDIAQKYAQIITITPEGKGSFLQSITYSDLTKKPLIYKENTDLVNAPDLNILSKSTAYKIF